MRLKPPAHLLLGMLRLGATSGYAIKKAADVSTRMFWPTSLAQVYPELARLEEQGLVNRRDDSHGARTRSAYEITPEGEAALLAWLRSEREAPVQLRDEGLLRLFFADALPNEDQLALVRRLRQRAQNVAAYMQSQGVPFTWEHEVHGARYPALTAQFGADLWTFTEQWLARLEAELEQGDSLPPSR
jgi:DNA-binding PadR family transcriptional regulator